MTEPSASDADPPLQAAGCSRCTGAPSVDAVYAALAARRVAYDQGIWTTPPLVVAIVSFTVAPMADWISSASHEQAVLGMTVCALAAFAIWASIRLIARHRENEVRDTRLLDLAESHCPADFRPHAKTVMQNRGADQTNGQLSDGYGRPSGGSTEAVVVVGVMCGLLAYYNPCALPPSTAALLLLFPMVAAGIGRGCMDETKGSMDESTRAPAHDLNPIRAYRAWSMVLWAYFAALCIGVGYFGATAVGQSGPPSCESAQQEARSALEDISNRCTSPATRSPIRDPVSP